MTPEKFTIRRFTTQTTSDARDVTRSRVTPHTQRHAARAQTTQPTDANIDTTMGRKKGARGGTMRRVRGEVEEAAAKEGRAAAAVRLSVGFWAFWL